VRIGTWNMAGKWSDEHRKFLEHEECDVWLFTEVPLDTEISGMTSYRTVETMQPHKAWAAIYSRVPPTKGTDPHRATASALVGEVRFVSSILPWRSCGAAWPGATLAEKQALTLAELRPLIDQATVWGGDWNQALEGTDYVGTGAGRATITSLLEATQLSIPTRSLGSATPGHRSIDHIAVPMAWDVVGAWRISANAQGRRLSDHDAYVVSVRD
jgi:hypothetical protein